MDKVVAEVDDLLPLNDALSIVRIVVIHLAESFADDLKFALNCGLHQSASLICRESRAFGELGDIVASVFQISKIKIEATRHRRTPG
jgi:hypothetical protein